MFGPSSGFRLAYHYLKINYIKVSPKNRNCLLIMCNRIEISVH
jgi:hypothetical protein